VEGGLTAAKIYIVEEHPTVRLALVDALARAGDVEVIGHTGDANLVLSEVESLTPDVVLVEVKRSDGMGLEIIRQICSLTHRPRIAVLTSYESDWEIEASKRAGADGYILKEIDADDLVRQIRLMAAA
jgi:two-component system nitrate/nitrite response regulator NarL